MKIQKHGGFGFHSSRLRDVELQSEPNRREFISGATSAAVLATLYGARGIAQSPETTVNIARVAIPSGYVLASENKISAVNDGFTPENSFDRSHGYYAFRSARGEADSVSWAQYEWT